MTHVFGYATAARVFDLPFDIVFECIADVTPKLAKRAAEKFGFSRSTSDWQEIASDPQIDLLDITAPNRFHKDMALAGIAEGKHIYCEKPLATNTADSLEMANAAQTAGVVTQVGFNYLSNPMFALAKSMIDNGELGEIWRFRGVHAEDYMIDPAAPWSWRLEPDGGGAFADLGSHVIATAEFLLGPIESVYGNLATTVPVRLGPDGERKSIEVDDTGCALLEFVGKASGTAEASWIATGQKMQHDFEIYGSKGSLLFSQSRLNELQYYSTGGSKALQGFQTILAGPEHEPYGRFCVAPGHQLGYNDLKAIEIANFIDAIAGKRDQAFGFRSGARIQSIVDSVRRSSRTQKWVSVS